MILLALDLATETGWAVGNVRHYVALTDLEIASGMHQSVVRSGSSRIAPEGEPIPGFVDGYVRWLDQCIDAHEPEGLIFEAAYLDPNKNPKTAQKLMTLLSLTEWVAEEKGVAWVRQAYNGSIRKHFIGVGKGKRERLKRMTMQACRRRGWNPVDDNEADALALFDYAAAVLNGAGAKRRRRAA